MAYYDEYYTQYQPVQTPLMAQARARAGGMPQRMPFLLLCAVAVSVLLFGKLLPGSLAADTSSALTVVAESSAPAAESESEAPPVVPPSAAPATAGALAPVFTAEVKHWEPKILEWAGRHGVDPNQVAIIMQIESCGDPQAVSPAGAQGLFQVMPFHFAAGENALDPETNAMRGINYFSERLEQTNGDVGRAFAGYNGGHVAAGNSWDQWAAETQRYYRWSTGIYQDIQNGLAESPTLNEWLQAGGASLCRQAAARLGLP